MAVSVDPSLVEDGLELLDEIGEHDDLAARACELDDHDVLALESLIRLTLQVGHFDIRFPNNDDDDSFVDTVLDAAELLAHRSTNSSVPLVVKLFNLLEANGDGLAIESMC